MTEEIKLRSNRKNLTGQKFGKLTVIKPVKTINDTSRWLCKCECGNEKIVATYRLLSGRVKTCGDCFNTINFYIPEIARLKQENENLKKEVKQIGSDFIKKGDYARVLEQENKELKSQASLYENLYNHHGEIVDEYRKQRNKIILYRSTLEEIREMLGYGYIVNKINEVLK